jgi:hypothetical protein
MRNKFPGVCYRCGKTVEPWKGHFERIKGGSWGNRWRIQHAECAIKYRGTKKNYAHKEIQD